MRFFNVSLAYLQVVMTTESRNNNPEENKQDRLKFVPIVGIGASAGGLEAFQQLFEEMPSDSGMAFIIVQHLDPTHKSMLVDLIDRFTQMQVYQIEDGMQVKPNCIYIIPPNHDLAIQNDVLELKEPAAARGFRLPIDYFFRSLAEEKRENAICIILSGTGSDGTLGLRAIKEEGGLAIVQDPASAKYHGMPHSAIATGLVDLILSPEEMPAQLSNYVTQALRSNDKRMIPASLQSNDAVQKIMMILRTETGHDFSQYKHNTIGRRIERRMVVNKISSIDDYVTYIRQNIDEADILFRELLIGVTSFFRDKDAFEMLIRKAFPIVFDNRMIDEPIRVWVTGCATGEEAYSLAIALQEYMEKRDIDREVQIFATDIDSDAINKARQGLYPHNIAADISSDRLDRWFIKEDNHYQVVKQIRNMVVFAIQSVIRDPPFSRLDIISCRNVLIYLGSELQRKVLTLFNYALRPGGILFLGTSESLGDSIQYFDEIDRRTKLFRRIRQSSRVRGRPFNFSHSLPDSIQNKHASTDKTVSNQEITERQLLDDFTPPSALINEKNHIIYMHKQLGQYLNLPEGEAEFDIFKMADQSLRIPLTIALRRAREQNIEVVQKNIQIEIEDKSHTIDLIVRPVNASRLTKGWLLALFKDVDTIQTTDLEIPASGNDTDYEQQLIQMEHELQSSRQYMQTLVEELETTNEEMTSTNEELQSANEELQSTNEELETATEELQSVNEELVTVNAELHAKIDELSHANNDLNSLLSTLDVGIIFVDLQLRIREFNPAVRQLVNLIDTDIGRPLAHIVANMEYTNLVRDAEEVLNTLIPFETELQTNDKKWYWMQIRPYRTMNNAIEGIVLTFTEITEQKRTEEELRTLTRAFEQTASLIIVTDNTWHIEYVNPEFLSFTQYSLADVEGKHLRSLKVEASNQDLQTRLWETVEAGEDWFGEFQTVKADGSPFWVNAAISPVTNDDGEIIQFVSIADNITERKSLEERLADADIYRMLARNLPGFAVLLFDEELRYLKVEGSALKDTGYDPKRMEGATLYDIAPKTNLEYLKDIYHRALTGETVEFQITGARSNQEFAGRAVPVHDEEGNIVAGMVLSWKTNA